MIGAPSRDPTVAALRAAATGRPRASLNMVEGEGKKGKEKERRGL